MLTFILENILVLLVTATLILLYQFSTRNLNYWKKRNVPYKPPLPFFGNFLEVLTLRSSIGIYLVKLYNEFKTTPYFGIYALNKPYLVLNDPNLIHSILITDFSHFCDRNISCDEKHDPIFGNFLPVVNNPKWKKLRAKVTPFFSPSKLKHMVNLINEVADDMVAYLKRNTNKQSLEVKEISSKFTIDVIGTCAFGIKAHCFDNENAEFRNIGRKMTSYNWRNALTHSCFFLVPEVAQFLKLNFFDYSVYDVIRRMFWDTVNERLKTKIKRNDLIDIILQDQEENESKEDIKLVGDLAVAVSSSFYAAGFETSSSALAFTLYLLCLHEDIQFKVRKEIKSVMSSHKEITYEALQDLKYMDMVIYESLRLYPPVPFIERICVKDYTIPNTELVIEKGTPLFVPSFAIQRDPQYYPNPEKFDPERFSNRIGDNICYLPFGAGPRSCIGIKLGMAETKIALIRILSEFKLEKCAETPVSMEFQSKTFLLHPRLGLSITFKKLT